MEHIYTAFLWIGMPMAIVLWTIIRPTPAKSNPPVVAKRSAVAQSLAARHRAARGRAWAR